MSTTPCFTLPRVLNVQGMSRPTKTDITLLFLELERQRFLERLLRLITTACRSASHAYTAHLLYRMYHRTPKLTTTANINTNWNRLTG